ncbi:DUF1819 family protein [Flavobacterium tegetincola]|uniref:DUF1819 family protein n=1 Tax=Flavobacterium tegetincola TaxID=150172 RepID=UPI00040E06DE|nr:DUF1819 family protein [Flavobacterium tegetincola]
MTQELEKYDFSFTTSSLRLNEMVVVATATTEGKEVDFVNDLGGGKSATGRKMLSEFNKRISFLTPAQLTTLVQSDLTTRRQIALVAVCKAYAFIRDFIIEVVREKLLVYDYKISDGDFISFYRRKTELHDEMEKLTELTQKKIKQVTFKILEQSGIINNIKERIIQPQFLDENLIKVLINDNPNWLKVLLVSDMDIKKAMK